MTVVSTPPVAATVAAGYPAPGRAVTRLALRQTVRGAVLVTGVAAGMSAVVVATYRDTVSNGLDAAALAALARNPAIRTLFGEPVALDDPGGFAVWRTGTVLAVLLSVWGLLAATRITRGEEDAGRWDLLLAGRLTLRGVVLRHVAVLGAAAVVAGASVAGALILAGASPAGAIVHGTGIALIGAFFVAVGTLAGQVFPARAAASGAAVAVLGVGLLIRMLGDGLTALAWLRWLSPVGLLALTRPYQDNEVLPLVVLAAGGAAVLAGAATVAGRRDVRGGWLTASPGRAPRRYLLSSVPAFAIRRLLAPLTAWSVGIGGYFLLIGVLTVSMTRFLTENPRFGELADEAGFAGLGTVTGYVATLFALLAVPAGAFVAVRLGTVAAEEADGRLTPLLAQPITRTRLLTAEIVAALAGAVVLTTAAGAATWLGATAVGAGLTLAAALTGAWNVLPIVLLCLGAAVLAIGWLPRAVAAVGALPAAGGFLLQVTAESAGAPRWVTNLSPFAHLAPVPDAPANWPAIGLMAAIAALTALVGAAGYRRRDLLG